MDFHGADGNAPTTSATRRARVFGMGAWGTGAALFGLACVERSPVLFAAFAGWYVFLAVIVFLVVVASRKSQVEAARQNAARFRELAIRDDLTGLFNRRYFTAELERQVRDCLEAGRPLSVATLDLDGFKRINDSFGHEAGDRALQAAGRAIAHSSPGEGTAARIGGDEFAVILPGHAGIDARQFAAGLHTALQRAGCVLAEGQQIRIRATIGVASLGVSADAEALLREADSALYAGKRAA